MSDTPENPWPSAVDPDALPPWIDENSNGMCIPRPPSATPMHVPVFHRFVDPMNPSETAEHISHWIIDPGPTGYLSETYPLDTNGDPCGSRQMQCLTCGLILEPIPLALGPYRVSAGRKRFYLRLQDDPDHEVPNA